MYYFQVKDEDEEQSEAGPKEAAVTEAVNGLVSGPEKPGPRLPEPATPGNSPARGAAALVTSPAKAKTGGFMKHSDSSFGLHSPDSFNDDVQVHFSSSFSLNIRAIFPPNKVTKPSHLKLQI